MPARASFGLPLWLALSAFLAAPTIRATPHFVPFDPDSLTGVSGYDLPGGGVALGDLDGDGDDDVVAVDTGRGVELRYADPLSQRLVPAGSAPTPAGEPEPWPALSAAVADVDGDGLTDLLLGATGGAYLLHGRASGGFDDRTPFAFDGLFRQASSFALADVDGDGLLDVHVVTYLVGADWPHPHCDRDALFLQREGGWVRAELPDATAGAGCGFGAVWFDQDGDGDPDAWVANDFGTFTVPSHVWRNDGVDAGGVLQIRDAAGAAARPVNTYAMGVAVGDADGDGLLDVASTSIGRAPLHRGLGGGRFEDQAESFGTGAALGRMGTRMTWGVAFADLDGDGETDLLEAGGYYPLDPALGSVPGGSPTLFYPGGSLPFREDAEALRALTDGGEYRGLALGDLDADGAPDLALAGAMGTDPLVLRNATDAPWLAVVPHGTVSPREARGAVVALTCAEGPRRTAVVPTGGNPGSMSAPRVFFSLEGCDASRARVVVDWPSGARSEHAVLAGAAGRVLAVEEPRWLGVGRARLVLGGDPALASATIVLTPGGAFAGGGAHAVDIAVLAGAGDVGPVTADPSGSFRATVTARAAGDLWLSLAVDGRALPRRVRLPILDAAAPGAPRAAPAALSPSRGVDVALYPRRADGSPYGPGLAIALDYDGVAGPAIAEDRGAGRYTAHVTLLPGRSAPARVRATLPGGETLSLDLPVVADADPARAQVSLRSGYRLETDPPAPVALYATLATPMGDPLPARAGHAIRLRGDDGTAFEPLTLGAPASSLFSLAGAANAAYTVFFDDLAASAPVAQVTLPTREALAALVDRGTSRLDPMLATLEADGVDGTALVLRLADANGNAVPDRGVQWEVTGGTLGDALPSPLDGSIVRAVVAGTSPGTLTANARVRDDLVLTTTIALLPASTEPAAALELCVRGHHDATAGTVLFASIYPRRANGLLAGGNRDVSLAVDALDVPLARDHGAYTAQWYADASRETTEVRAQYRGLRVPPSPAPPIEASLSLPTGALSRGEPAWFGDPRCITVSAPGAASDGGMTVRDAGVSSPDGGARPDAARDAAMPDGVGTAQDAHAAVGVALGGGCDAARITGPRHGADGIRPATILALALAAASFARRARRGETTHA